MLGKWPWVLSAILILAFGLRLYALDAENLWSDEAFTVHHAGEQNYEEFITLISTTEAAPPGHYLFLHYWLWWFGDSEFSVRFPSVLFGVAAVGVLFLIVRRLGNETMAILSSLFMATSMLQVLFSQEARLYSLFTLLVLLAVYCLMNTILRKKKWSYFWGYVVTMALALTVNYLAVVVIVLSIALLGVMTKIKTKELMTTSMTTTTTTTTTTMNPKNLSLPRKTFLWWTFIQGILVLVLGIWLWPILKKQFSGLNSGLNETLMSKGLPWFLAKLGLAFYALPVILFVLALLVLLRLKPIFLRLLQHQRFDAFFSLLVIAAGSGYIYLSFFPVTFLDIPLTRYPLTHSYFLIRHSFFLAPLWYVFLAWKISSLRWKKVAVVMAILVVAVSGTALYEYYTQTTKAEWKPAALFIAGQSGEQEPLILLDKAGFSNEFLLDYYFPKDYRLIKLTFSGRQREFTQLSEAEALSELSGEKEFWLVLARNTRTGDYYRDLFDQHYRRTVSQEFYEVQVYGYKMNT